MTSWNFWRVCVLSSVAPHPPYSADKSDRQATLLTVLTQAAKGAINSVHFVDLHKPDLHDNHGPPPPILPEVYTAPAYQVVNLGRRFRDLSLSIYVKCILKHSPLKVN
jgi:hypothetical protein